MKKIAIIPAGGIGKRITSSIPKQFLKFNDKELIAYTLEVFQKSSLIDEIIIASQKSYFPLLEQIKNKFEIEKLLKIVEGGQERQHSVYNALLAANASSKDIIIVHDAVRPMLSQSILKDAIESAERFGAAVVAMHAKDTLLKGSVKVENYIDRSGMYYVQTPQCFFYEILMNAMESANKDNFIGTDESMLVHRAGYDVQIVNGSSLNMKITTDDDIKIFSALLDNKTAN